ncbi:unnamed protein product [Polarella glacialis]|uniref:HTH araC/xylS-type domain-containing protein n=2 Tax=Polarella glacialis TaxID=89957 RepID=A0A813FQT3_POLGL|nr:unnamed protein product [Polarella glacialis]
MEPTTACEDVSGWASSLVRDLAATADALQSGVEGTAFMVLNASSPSSWWSEKLYEVHSTSVAITGGNMRSHALKYFHRYRRAWRGARMPLSPGDVTEEVLVGVSPKLLKECGHVWQSSFQNMLWGGQRALPAVWQAEVSVPPGCLQRGADSFWQAAVHHLVQKFPTRWHADTKWDRDWSQRGCRTRETFSAQFRETFGVRPGHFRDTSGKLPELPGNFRGTVGTIADPCGTLPGHFQDTSRALPGHFRDTGAEEEEEEKEEKEEGEESRYGAYDGLRGCFRVGFLAHRGATVAVAGEALGILDTPKLRRTKARRAAGPPLKLLPIRQAGIHGTESAAALARNEHMLLGTTENLAQEQVLAREGNTKVTCDGRSHSCRQALVEAIMVPARDFPNRMVWRIPVSDGRPAQLVYENRVCGERDPSSSMQKESRAHHSTGLIPQLAPVMGRKNLFEQVKWEGNYDANWAVCFSLGEMVQCRIQGSVPRGGARMPLSSGDVTKEVLVGVLSKLKQGSLKAVGNCSSGSPVLESRDLEKCATQVVGDRPVVTGSDAEEGSTIAEYVLLPDISGKLPELPGNSRDTVGTLADPCGTLTDHFQDTSRTLPGHFRDTGAEEEEEEEKEEKDEREAAALARNEHMLLGFLWQMEDLLSVWSGICEELENPGLPEPGSPTGTRADRMETPVSSDRRKEVENVVLNEDGLYINEFLRSLQDDNRLLTWNRPSRLPGGAARPNTLMVQKYYQSGKPIGFRNLRARPIVLSQAMGAGSTLKVGESVEALKPGYFTDNDLWSPSKWEKAEVLAVNYDGTYDLQFFMDHGPYRENRKKGLRGTPTLSLRRNEVYADFGADKMPAKFRMMKELNYSQAVDPSQIRMPGMLDRLSDTNDTEGSQDWYICTSKKFLLTASGKGDEQRRLDDFSRQFQFDYRWVATADGDLRFEPLPNPNMAMSLKACHNEVAQQFASAANADEEARRKLLQYKGEMDEYQELLESPVQTKTAKPSRPAGPKGRGLLEEELEPVRVGR